MKKKLLIFVLTLILSINSLCDSPINAEDIIGEEIGVWNIDNGKIEASNGKNEELAKTYWETIHTLLPEKLVDKYIRSLRLYTDGEKGDLGGMNQLDESNSNWQFDLDIKDMKVLSQDKEEIIDSTHTLIHEFGHLLTLNIEQIKPKKTGKFEFGNYETYEGYSLKKSYLNRFVNSFWNEGMLDEWYKIDNIESEEDRQEMLYEFYLDHQDEFVTDYAAENPEEDIAESWTFFILSDKPLGNSIKEEKILFFYQFPELIKYRESIRKNVKIFPENYLETYKNE